MHTIEEEPEDESTEELTRGGWLRESLSKIQPRDRIRSVGNGWVEYVTPSGRLYYYNSETQERSWKPPRKFPGELQEEKNISPPQDSMLSREWESAELGRTDVEEETKPTSIGKILRTGMLKTSSVEVNGGKVKKKWVKSFVVLTEYFLLLTPCVGNLKKIFKKTKNPKPSRLYLLDAFVTKDTEISSRGNVYRLKTTCKDVLFRSKNTTAAESWFQALTLVINNLKDNKLDFIENVDLKERERTNSFDLGPTIRRREMRGGKSVSLSNFSVDDTDGPKSRCLSDYFGLKYPTPPGWITIFDSGTEQFCYVNCITGKKWFRAMTDDGHPYFYEEGYDRRSWLLPSIYLDVNSQVFKRSSGSLKSLQSNL